MSLMNGGKEQYGVINESIQQKARPPPLVSLSNNNNRFHADNVAPIPAELDDAIKNRIRSEVNLNYPPSARTQVYEEMIRRYEHLAAGNLSGIFSPITPTSALNSQLSPSLPPPSPFNYNAYSPRLPSYSDNRKIPQPLTLPSQQNRRPATNQNNYFVFPDVTPPAQATSPPEIWLSHPTQSLSTFTSSPSFPLQAPPIIHKGPNSSDPRIQPVINTYSIHSSRQPFGSDPNRYIRSELSASSVALTPPLTAVSATSLLEPTASHSLTSASSPFLPSNVQLPLYSRKVFVGGLPWDVQREYVQSKFGEYGEVEVDWPRETLRTKELKSGFDPQVNGYVFLVYKDELSVRRLMEDCLKYKDNFFMAIFSRSCYKKLAQVRPWLLSSTNYLPNPQVEVDPRKTIFIGGLPRITTAENLAKTLEQKYGRVLCCSVDVDPDMKYPKGAARVCFETHLSYLLALNDKFITLPNIESSKRDVQIKPYIMDSEACEECFGVKCHKRIAPFYCAECKQFFCQVCWNAFHEGRHNATRQMHRPLMRVGDQSNDLPASDDIQANRVDEIVDQLMPRAEDYTPDSLYPLFHI